MPSFSLRDFTRRVRNKLAMFILLQMPKLTLNYKITSECHNQPKIRQIHMPRSYSQDKDKEVAVRIKPQTALKERY
jgi:hypothetical protein